MTKGLSIAALLIFPASALAAPSFVQGISNSIGSGTSINCVLPATVGAGHLLVVGLRSGAGNDVTSVSDGSNTYTQRAEANLSSQARGEQWYAVVSTAANLTITATRASSSGVFQCVALEFAGTAGGTFTANGTAATSATSGHSASLSIPSVTTTTPSAVLVATIAVSGAESSWTSPAGYTIPSSGSSTRVAMAYRFVASTGSYSGTWSLGSGSNDGVSIQAAYGEGGGSSAPGQAYFDSVCAAASTHVIWCEDLRTQWSIDKFSFGTNRDPSTLSACLVNPNDCYHNQRFSYVWGSDTYSDPQDGAKFVFDGQPNDGGGSARVEKVNQIHFPILAPTNGTVNNLVVIWEAWEGSEFRDYMNFNQYKHFQLSCAAEDAQYQSDGAICHEFRSVWSDKGCSGPSCAYVSAYDQRVYGSGQSSDGHDPEGLSGNGSPFTPTGPRALATSGYKIKWGKWRRYVSELKLSMPASAFGDSKWYGGNTCAPSGTSPCPTWNSTYGVTVTGGPYRMWSTWIVDEDRNATMLLDHAPWVIRAALPNIQRFWFEFNTSSSKEFQTGTVTGYYRNVIILRNYDSPGGSAGDGLREDDTLIFGSRPVR